MNKVLILLVFAFAFSSCNNSNKLNDVAQNETTDINITHPGKKLMEIYCYACHNPTTEHDSRLAPPMIAIKKRYINKNTTKEAFIKDLQDWVKNPNKTDAKMFGAVQRFGVMTKIDYPEDDIKQIADYIYDNAIEQPLWFEDHYNEQRRNQRQN